MREQRAGYERPATMACRWIFFDDVCTGHVCRHEIWRELNALETQAERICERAHEQGLRSARHAGDQTMPANEHRQQQMIDDVVLPDDDPSHLFADRAEPIAE